MIVIIADGERRELISSARTVQEALAEAGVAVGVADLVTPQRDNVITADPATITVVRVTETTEVIPEAIPYQRQIVRSAEMSPDDPPRLLQPGQTGLQEVTVRIVYHDGLETERWPTSTAVIEPARDEIIMIGVATAQERMTFDGLLAYINDGRAILLNGASDAPRQMEVEGQLDGRVFQLSPDGRYLLYTTTVGESAGTFRNTLWLLAVAPGSAPRPLAIENVLWAGWDPAADPPRIAYTTARSVSLPPGWEASNDLWLLELAEGTASAPIRLIESYPAAYAWWGGQYAWSHDGRLAYAFADEVGVLTLPEGAAAPLSGLPGAGEPARTILHTFSAFDTGADWAWVPSLAWSGDGQRLAFSTHVPAQPPAGERFDLMLADTTTGESALAVEGAGIWSAAQWSPAAGGEDQIAYLRTTDPERSQDSGYVLWLADGNGRNARRIYPPEGENSRFSPSQSLAWGSDPNRLAFIFDNALHILDLSTGEVYQTGPDDTISSHPTWAPYGPAAGAAP